jgi:hypothetical protein
MTNQHPITPPPELVQQWWEQADQYQDDPKTYFDYVAIEAAQWGADQELEACCGLLIQQGFDVVDYLRAARRPKPPSLKELALEALDAVDSFGNEGDRDTIRRALEQLDD